MSDATLTRVTRIDPSGLPLQKIPVGNGPSAIAVGENAVWVTDTSDDRVERIDDPFDFLNILFDGNLMSTIGYNVSRFDEPMFNRRLEAAAKLTGPARYSTYARLDADLARDGAPIVAFANGAGHDLFSTRIGCQIYSPDGMDLPALCIRGSTKH